MSKFIDFILRGKDLLSGKSDKAATSIGALKTEIKSLDKELRAVEQAQSAVKVFSELSSESKSLSSALDQTKDSIKKYAIEQSQASALAEQAGQKFNKLKVDAKELNVSYKEQSKALNSTENSLKNATVKMREQSDAVRANKSAIEATTTKYKEQKQQLDLLEQKYKGSKKPLDDLNNSYKIARSQLTALEQVQRKQATQLERSKASYQAAYHEVGKLQQSQASYRSALAKTELALNGTNKALTELKTKQSEANTSLDVATRNYKAAAAAMAKFQKDLTVANSKLDKAQSKLKNAGVETDKLAEATERLANKQQALVGKTQKAFNSLATLTAKLKGVRAAMHNAGAGIGAFTGRLAALGGTYLSIRGITDALWGMVSTGASFQTMRIQFEGIMGSVASGEQAFQWVTDFARDTPLQMNEVTQAFVFLKGAGLDPMNGTLQAITDSVAKYTGGTEKLTNVTRQLAQAWAKGKINAKDFNAIMDNDLPVWNLLSQATGKQVGELLKLSEQSRLGRYEMRLLFEEMKSDAPGAAARLMQTFNGQLEQASHNIKVFFDLVAQSGALDVLQKKLSGFNTELRKMADDGSLKQFAQELSDRFVQMVSDVSGSLKTLFTDLKGFTKSVSNAFDTISISLNIFTSGVRGLIAVVAGAMEVTLLGVSKLTSAFGLLENPISKAEESLSKFFGELRKEALKQMSVDAEKTRQAFDRLRGASDEAATGIDRLQESSATLHKLIEPLGNVLNATSAEALAMAKNILASGNELEKAGLPADRLKATVEALIAKLKDDPSPEVQSIVIKISQQYQKLGDAAKKLPPTLKELEASFENLGGKTLQSLKDKVKETALTFKEFSKAKKPISELRQVFLDQLDAQVALANATNQSYLPSVLNTQAAQLGLTDAFNKANIKAEKNYQLLNFLTTSTDNLTAAEQRLQNQQNKGKNLTQEQTEEQIELNAANAKAASHAGANVAFQKLWNEAKERSLKLYDLLSLSTDELRIKTNKLGESLSGAFRSQSWSNILKPINDLNNAAKRNEVQAIAQTRAYKALFERMEKGTVSLKELNHFSREAGNYFDKLDKTNLSNLHAQIDRAKQATADLKGELVDTVHDLKNELDDLEGNQAKVLERDYQADKIELKEKLKQAEKTGDAQALVDAKEALRIAEQIFRIKSKAITTEQTEQIQTTKKVNENNNTTTNIKEVRQVQEIHYKVTFAVGGRSSTFNSTSGSNVEQLITSLAEAGFTVTRT